jgi:hypothetical protein
VYRILTINRPSAYEGHLYLDDRCVESSVSVYRPALGRYSPSVDDTCAVLARWRAQHPDAVIEHLSR